MCKVWQGRSKKTSSTSRAQGFRRAGYVIIFWAAVLLAGLVPRAAGAITVKDAELSGKSGSTLSLRVRDAAANASITDPQAGLDSKGREQSNKRLGLTRMRQQVKSIGGSFRIESKAGLGPHVVADLLLELVADEYAQ